MEEQIKISKDTGVNVVPELLSGNDLMPSDSMNGTGLGCGLKKAIACVNYALSLATAGLNFNKSKITGSIDCLMNI